MLILSCSFWPGISLFVSRRLFVFLLSLNIKFHFQKKIIKPLTEVACETHVKLKSHTVLRILNKIEEKRKTDRPGSNRQRVEREVIEPCDKKKLVLIPF